MPPFKVVSDYRPAGDQPQAIDALARGLELGLDEQTLLDVFAGVPQFEVDKALFETGVKLADLVVDHAAAFPSKGEVKTLVKGGGVSINKEKATAADQMLTTGDLLDGKYLLVQQGKKKYNLIIAK